MNTAKLNDWLQIAAAIGVIGGLVLVAYEIRVSNRIGIEQGNAASVERWEVIQQMALSRELAELWVRAHEGAELSRAEAFMLNNFVATVIAAVDYDLQLDQNETMLISIENYLATLQYFLATDYFKRRWKTLRNLYNSPAVALIDEALSMPEQRDILGYLDYIRGATNESDWSPVSRPAAL